MPDKNEPQHSEEKDDPRKKAHRLEKTIEDSAKDYEQAASDVSSQIGKKEEAIKNELKEANAELAKLKQELSEKSAELRKDTNDWLWWIRKKVEDLETICYVITFLFAVSYIVYLLWFQVAFTLENLLPLGMAATLSVLVGFSARIAKRNLADGTYTINHYLTDITSKIASAAGRKLKSHESFEAVDQGLRSAGTLAKRVLAATKEYNPALKAMYDQASFQTQLGDFTHTLSNALQFYGLALDAESAKWLRSFQSLGNTDIEWLTDAAKPLAEKLDTSPLIVSLLYCVYVDNSEGTKNAWARIRKDDKALPKLATIMLKNSSGSHVDYSNPKLAEVSLKFLSTMDEFDPRKFDEMLRSFSVELHMLKSSVRLALAYFGFKLNSSQERAISDFVPGEIEVGNWKDKLLEISSASVHRSKETVALLVEEYLGNVAEAQGTFAKIKQSEPKTNELLNILLANGILKIPDRYVASTESVLRVLRHLVSARHFLSIEHLRDESSQFFGELDSSKQRILEALAAYNIKIPEALRTQFESDYLPDEVSIPEMIDFFAKERGIEKEFLFLFYHEFTKDTAALQRAFADVLKHNSAKDLAKLLIELGFIETSGDSEAEIDNLESVVLSFETFRMPAIQSRYESFRNLLVWSSNLAAFCGEHELATKDFKVELPWLLKLLKNKNLKSYEQLQVVCDEILAKSGMPQSTPDNLRADVVATLVLFFKSQEDSRLYEACRDAAKSDLVSKMLYHFISRQEEARQLKQERVTLRTAVQEVVTGTGITYPYIDDVRDKLAIGRVPDGISVVATARFDDHLKEVTHLVREKEEVLKGLQSSLHNFFKAELREDVILQLLRMQVISAYIITTPSDKPVISLIDNEMVPKFRDLFVIERGTGRYTRIGIVPIGMSFEQFHGEFKQIFQDTVGEHCTVNPSQKRADFSANIIRIFPVEATFKAVSGDPVATKITEDPVNTIRELFLDRVPAETNLALAATARVNDPERLALRKVILSLFNDYTNLLLLRKDRIEPLIGTRKSLLTAFESGAFDKQLLARMQCEKLAELAQKVNTIASTSKGKQEIKQAIAGHVASILKTFQVRMDSQERENLANEIFEGLQSIGLVLATQ